MNQDGVPLRSPNEDGRIDQDYDQHFAGKSIILLGRIEYARPQRLCFLVASVQEMYANTFFSVQVKVCTVPRCFVPTNELCSEVFRPILNFQENIFYPPYIPGGDELF
ncbi:hypothetical protein [Sphingobacterium sp. NPDC055346]